jgi:hypothetical protein
MATRRRRVTASPTTRPTDYLTVPVGEIGSIRSVLTMVGGKIVFADAFATACEVGTAFTTDEAHWFRWPRMAIRGG